MGTTTGGGTEPAGTGPAGVGAYTSTALERGTFQWGALVYPLATGGGESAIAALDPALSTVLDYIEAMLIQYAGGAWSERSLAVAGQFEETASTIVASKCHYDPAPHLKANQFKFPLLAVWRTKSRNVTHTLEWERTDSTWRMDWVLPPMTAAQAEVINPFLWAVFPIFVKKIIDLQDDAYQSGAQLAGAGSISGIMEMQIVGDAVISAWDAGGKLVFPTLSMTAQVKERAAVPDGAFDPITGVDAHIDATPAPTSSGPSPSFLDAAQARIP